MDGWVTERCAHSKSRQGGGQKQRGMKNRVRKGGRWMTDEKEREIMSQTERDVREESCQQTGKIKWGKLKRKQELRG